MQIFRVLIVTACLVFGVTYVAFSADTIENGFSSIAALVAAKSITVREGTREGDVAVTLQIETVYSGPKELKGQSFQIFGRRHAHGGRSGIEPVFELDPSPILNETGIWWVLIPSPTKKRRLGAIDMRCFATQLPSRKGIGPRYDEVLEWAEAVERISSTPRDEQLKLLQGFAQSRNFETSVWAITVLHKEWGQKADRVLGELVSHRDLAPAAITALDAALNEIQGDSWRNSVERWTLTERSLRSVRSDMEADLVIDYWETLARDRNRHDLSAERCLEIVKRAFGDPDCPDRIRNRLFMSVLRVPFLTTDDDEAIWAFAIEQISQPLSTSIAGNAAFMLMDARNRTPRRFRTLLKLYREEKHPRVAESLGNVLAKWHQDATTNSAESN